MDQTPVIYEAGNDDLMLRPVMDVQQALARLKEFQTFINAIMVDGVDYGTIPGTEKPTLYKPGAEKLCELYGLAPTFEIIESIKDWLKGFCYFEIKCRLVSKRTGAIVAEGIGSCNSLEDRYRWRNAKRKCPACGAETIIKGKAEYGGGWLCWTKQSGCGAKFADDDPSIVNQAVGKVENTEPYTVFNTIFKQGKKRALVDAALTATRSSGIWTQDIEDWAESDSNSRGTTTPQNGTPKQESQSRPSSARQAAKTKPETNAPLDDLFVNDTAGAQPQTRQWPKYIAFTKPPVGDDGKAIPTGQILQWINNIEDELKNKGFDYPPMPTDLDPLGIANHWAQLRAIKDQRIR